MILGESAGNPCASVRGGGIVVSSRSSSVRVRACGDCSFVSVFSKRIAGDRMGKEESVTRLKVTEEARHSPFTR